MLCGWWSPKACQDNGSNASAAPLNYCCGVAQRHYLTRRYLDCQRQNQALLIVAKNLLVWYVTWEILHCACSDSLENWRNADKITIQSSYQSLLDSYINTTIFGKLSNL